MRQVFAGNAAQACRLNQVKGGPVGIDDACASATGLQPSQRASSDPQRLV